MDRIFCGARNCAYNMSGSCAAGVVQVAEAVSPAGGTPYCATFSRESAPGNLLRAGSLRGAPPENRSLCCVMLRCRYHSQGLCEKSAPQMLPPRPAESTFVPCGSYERK